MDEWLEVDPRDLSDEELTERLRQGQALRAQLDGAELATLAEWDARMAWAADGARTGGAWLQGHAGMAGSTARERVRVARALRSMPGTAAAFAAGDISYAKVRVLAKALRDATRERFLADEELLVGYAKTFGADDLERLVAHWLACADPDGATAEAAERWNRRGASLADVQGTGHLKAILDPESMAIFQNELEALMADAYDTDRRDKQADAAAAVRSAQQRRLDSLVEMARRSAACTAGDAGRSQPEIVVTVDYDTYLHGAGTGELARGGRISGEAVRRLACNAGIVRAVVAGRSELLDLGRSTPVPNAAQRRGAALRWSSCFWPGCDVPAAWAQLHHINHYRRGHSTGGDTNVHELAPLCSHHHRRIHDDGYKATHDPNLDSIDIRRPDGTHIATVVPNGPITRRPALLWPVRAAVAS